MAAIGGCAPALTGDAQTDHVDGLAGRDHAVKPRLPSLWLEGLRRLDSRIRDSQARHQAVQASLQGGRVDCF
jgi:hypothetical protein